MDYQQRWYQKNKQEIKKRARIYNLKAREITRAKLHKLKDVRCADCQKKYGHWAMQFDHVRGKKLFDVCTAAIAGFAWTTILREIKKCEVVCANCHFKRTHDRNIAKGLHSCCGRSLDKHPVVHRMMTP